MIELPVIKKARFIDVIMELIADQYCNFFICLWN